MIRYMEQMRKNSVHRSLLFFVVFALLTIFYLVPSNAYAAAEWEVTLRVEAETGGHDRLILGADYTATDGYDPIWEVYAMLGGDIKAYFPHPEWGMVHQVFWKDIRAKAPGTTEWLFEVESSLSNTDINITWDLSRVPDSYAVILTDETALQEIDMHAAPSYGFVYTTGIRSFRVAVTAIPDIEAPDTPQRLRGRSVPFGVMLLWNKNKQDDLDGYNVYRSTTPGSGYQKINTSLIRWHRYTDKDVTTGETYYYVVTAVNTSGGESEYSNEVRVTIHQWERY